MVSPPPYCITLEEHAVFPSLGDDLPFYQDTWRTFPSVPAALRDHDTGRLAEMDSGRVRVQVLSHLPGLSNDRPAACTAANDEMAAAIARHPDRLAGLAALPMNHPAAAAAELERAVTQLGLRGAMVDDALADGITQYDGARFRPVWAAAERLGAPVYIHPSPPPRDVWTQPGGRFFGNYNDVVAQGIAVGGWGWHEHTGLHVVKLYAAGLFDSFPRLKIVVGHMGEMLPMWIDRIEELQFFRRQGLGSFREVWERNVWVTSAGIFSARTLEMLLKVTAIDRVMHSVDSPFITSRDGWRFIEELAEKGTLTQEELEMYAYGNAMALLKLS